MLYLYELILGEEDVKGQKVNPIIVFLSIVVTSIFSYAVDASTISYAYNLKELACKNGDAIACYKVGFKIVTTRTMCESVSGFDPKAHCPKPQPKRVQDWYTKACQYGYAYGCAGIGKKFDKEKASLLQNQCKKKDIESCNKLGLMYYTNYVGELHGSDQGIFDTYGKILKKSEEYYKKSCNYGSGKGCYFLASVIGEVGFYRRKENSLKDMITAYEQAAKLGYGLAYTYSRMAGIFSTQPTEDNQTKETYYRGKACDNGSVENCVILSFSLLRSSDGLKDPAVRKYGTKACELGYAPSCDKIAIAYDKGLGVQQDYFKAVYYYKKACKSAVRTSCANLGVKYYNGQGVRQDYIKAKHYFEDACSENEISACNNLGLMYNNGVGAVQDYFKAKNLFEKACNLPQPQLFSISPSLGAACINLGKAYLEGLGTRQNLQKAKEYFGKACDNGLQSGCSAYAKLNRLGK